MLILIPQIQVQNYSAETTDEQEMKDERDAEPGLQEHMQVAGASAPSMMDDTATTSLFPTDF